MSRPDQYIGTDVYSRKPARKASIEERLKNMPVDDAARVIQLVGSLKKKQRYQQSLMYYAKDRFGIPNEMIEWSRYPEYKSHVWDGTSDPLFTAARAIEQSKYVALYGAKGVSKTWFLALLARWFFESFDNAIVVTTAPKGEQLELHIWKEIGTLDSKVPVGALTKLRLCMHETQKDWLVVGFIAGVKPNEVQVSATRAHGFHAEHMLVIIEEMTGVHHSIISAFEETSIAPHNIIIGCGNPNHKSDELNKFASRENVVPVRISAYDHPNIVCNNANLMPGAVSKEGIEKLRIKFGGETAPFYLSRVRGMTPEQSINSLIMLEWCYAARDAEDRDVKGMVSTELGLGVDVARSDTGDKAAVAFGVGPILTDIETFQCTDTNKLGRQLHQIMKERKIKPEMVGVDGIGVGAGVVDTLIETGDNVVSLISSAASVVIPDDTEVYFNLRAQMWWQMREDLRTSKIVLPNDEELFIDLTTPMWYTRNGKICVEAKDDLRHRIGRSTDKGDAAVYWNWIRNLNSTGFAEKTYNYGVIKRLDGDSNE